MQRRQTRQYLMISFQEENFAPSVNVKRQPIGLNNLGSTGFLNTLIQMTLLFSPMQRSMMHNLREYETELAKATNTMITYFDVDEIVELSSYNLQMGACR